MTDNDPAGSAPPEKEPDAAPPDEEPDAAPPDEEPDDASPDEDPGYLTQTGEAVGDDGSVAPIIGGLPAVEGSAWDIGAPSEDRGAGLAEDLEEGRPDQGGDGDAADG